MAKAFNFSLQKVLDLRKHEEDQRSVELTKAQQKLMNEEIRLKKLNQSKKEVLQKDSTESDSEVDISLTELKVTNQYIEQMNEEITLQKDQVKKSNKTVEKNRENLLSAVKNKKVVELLKERYSEKYRKIRNLEATKNESEIALRVSMRNKENS